MIRTVSNWSYLSTSYDHYTCNNLKLIIISDINNIKKYQKIIMIQNQIIIYSWSRLIIIDNDNGDDNNNDNNNNLIFNIYV